MMMMMMTTMIIIIIIIGEEWNYEAPYYVTLTIFLSLFPPKSKHSPQRPVLKRPQSVFFLLYEKPRVTPIQNRRKIYTSV
jgi:hypothetical protein